jgi:hypothetical protein
MRKINDWGFSLLPVLKFIARLQRFERRAPRTEAPVALLQDIM